MFYVNPEYISKERYDLGKLLPWKEDNFDVLDSYFLENFKNLPVKGVFTITVEEERPDLISHKIYDTVIYTHLIMLYNDILDLSELKTGRLLNYFSVSDLESLYFSLKSLQG